MLQRGGAALTPAGTCSASVRAKAVQTPHVFDPGTATLPPLQLLLLPRTECSRLLELEVV